MNDVERAAIVWWLMKKPAGWTDGEFLANPTCNSVGDAEKRLACAVAEMLDLDYPPEIRRRGWLEGVVK